MKRLKNSIGSGILFFSFLGIVAAQQPDATVPQSQGQTPQAPAGQMTPVPDRLLQPAPSVQPAQPALPGELPSQRPVFPPAPAPGVQPPRPSSPVIPQKGLPAQTVPPPAQPVTPAQGPSQGTTLQTPRGMEQSGPSVPAAPQQVPFDQTAPAPGEPLSVPQPKGVVQVEFENERVNVLAENNTFGEVMNAMAQKARFTIKLPHDLSSRRISISLYDVPLERAIIRLFSLVQEKNYQVKYGLKGEVERIEVVTSKKAKQPGERGQPSIPGSGRGFETPQRRYSPRMMPPQNVPQPQQPSYVPPQIPPVVQPEEPAGDGENEDMQ